MYKKFTLEELSTIQNNLIPHLHTIIQREKCQWVNDFFKVAFREWNEVMFFDRGNPLITIQLIDNRIHINDEVDNIQIQVPANEKGELNRLMIRYISKKQRQIWQRTIEQILMDAFVEWKFYDILWKPYLVYDIETALISWEVSETNFPEYYLWFSLEETEAWKMTYSCIMMEDLKEFVQKMLDFDGYIIWYNQIYFDNPVSVYNVWLSKKEVEILNEKSLDLYVFFQQLTWKRMWLNKVSDSLVWVKKTLDSWADVESLWKERKSSNDNKILKKIQEYCKNDVRMTALVLLYLLHFQKVDMDNEDYTFNTQKFIELAKPSDKNISETKIINNNSLFW